ncbi:MAG: MotA/TolQ/ExbB proton channel family protein [Myxococcota bacterium]
MEQIAELYGHSVFLYPVTVCAVIALVISLERLYFLLFRATVSPEPFFREIQRLVLADDLDKAIRLCSAEPKAPLANVVKAALLHANGDKEDLALAVEHASLDAVPAVQRRVGYLAMLANVVTLFGLLGTIVGLIDSFAAVAAADPEEKQNMLAQGIAMAMYTTAGGISVAIPCLVSYAVLVQRGNAILDDVERYGTRLLLLLRARRPHVREQVPAEPAAEPG